MIRTIRIYFLSRLLREKILLVGFALLGVLLWLSSFGGRSSRFLREQRNTTVALREQAQWLASSAMIDGRVQKAAAQLDPAKTLDGMRLATEVSNAAAKAGVRNAAGEPATIKPNGPFSEHTMNYTVQNADDWRALEKFYVSLRDQAPYIGIDQFTLVTNPASRGKLTLSLKISSMEIAR